MENNKTAVEWLKDMLEWNYGDTQMLKIEWKNLDDLIKRAKQMEKEQIENTRPQIISNCVIKEISDEEIDKQAEPIELGIHRMFFKTGAKWYREQLKKRQ